jgi:hypothetical protein
MFLDGFVIKAMDTPRPRAGMDAGHESFVAACAYSACGADVRPITRRTISYTYAWHDRMHVLSLIKVHI